MVDVSKSRFKDYLQQAQRFYSTNFQIIFSIGLLYTFYFMYGFCIFGLFFSV